MDNLEIIVKKGDQDGKESGEHDISKIKKWGEVEETWSSSLMSIFNVRRAYIGQKDCPPSEDQWMTVRKREM